MSLYECNLTLLGGNLRQVLRECVTRLAVTDRRQGRGEFAGLSAVNLSGESHFLRHILHWKGGGGGRGGGEGRLGGGGNERERWRDGGMEGWRE